MTIVIIIGELLNVTNLNPELSFLKVNKTIYIRKISNAIPIILIFLSDLKVPFMVYYIQQIPLNLDASFSAFVI